MQPEGQPTRGSEIYPQRGSQSNGVRAVKVRFDDDVLVRGAVVEGRAARVELEREVLAEDGVDLRTGAGCQEASNGRDDGRRREHNEAECDDGGVLK